MAGGTVAQSDSFKVLSITGLYSSETLNRRVGGKWGHKDVLTATVLCSFEKLTIKIDLQSNMQALKNKGIQGEFFNNKFENDLNVQQGTSHVINYGKSV